MATIIEVVMYAVISTIITIMMTVYYVKHYKEISMGYPVTLLAIFTVLMIMNAFPAPAIFGEAFNEWWQDASNGGFMVTEVHGILTPIGLILLTIKLYCTSNIIVLAIYYLIRFFNIFKIKRLRKQKNDALVVRKVKSASRDNLPLIGEDFSFITDAMPVNGIMSIDGLIFEVLNNTGKKIPAGRKKIYAKRLNDHQQLDSKTDAVQPEEKIPYIEIWAIETIE